MKVLVTGGSGFIGSHYVRNALSQKHAVLNVDVETYAASDPALLERWFEGDYRHDKIDICDKDALQKAWLDFAPDCVVHFAAESHVDRSIKTPHDFVATNVLGTANLLAVGLDYWRSIKPDFRMIVVSTDEVFGSLGKTGHFNESSPYLPNSPYSASKAGSDHLARAYYQTYGFPVITTNCSNNFGPNQHKEKLIPTIIRHALRGQNIPIYGNGQNVRDWIYVSDHVSALDMILAKGVIGEQYLIGGENELNNIEIATKILFKLKELHPSPNITKSEIEYVEDRLGHDFRYAVDTTKLQTQLGWELQFSFNQALEDTLLWYVKNTDWALS
ncbi:MAG: dTDP-glucose 4,6-dehydratase [Pseudomonadota bacterium]